MPKIARLSKNVKVAQKLRSATSQFSGGTRTSVINKSHQNTDIDLDTAIHLSFSDHFDVCEFRWGYRRGSPTAIQAWQPCRLWEPSPSHHILL